MRRIPYKPVASYSPKSSPDGSPVSPTPPSPSYPAHPSAPRPKLLSSASPYLVIQSSDLLRSTARVAYPNIAIQCFLKDDVIRVRLFLPHECERRLTRLAIHVFDRLPSTSASET